MSQKVIQHPQWGPLVLRKNKRAKRLILRIKEGNVQVTLPQHVSYQKGIELVNDQQAWIEGRLTEAREQRQLDWDLILSIRDKTLELQQHQHKKIQLQAEGKRLILLLPVELALATHEGQNQLRHALIEVLRQEAKFYLPQRTHQLAAQYGITIRKVFIKHVKTRWGSCSTAGNINLSLYLMLLPDSWIDYVITHELAHIQHPNHSVAFWSHLENLMPGAGVIDQALKGYQRPF